TRPARRSPGGTASVPAAARRRGVLDQRIGRFPPTLTLWLAMAQEAPPAGSDEERPLPDLSRYEAVLFDLDGVLTPTVEVHMRAWASLFEDYLAQNGVAEPYTDRDYFDHIDGKQRYQGVAEMLASRGLELPWGDPTDPPEADTVCGLGNRKDAVFKRVLREE